MYTTVEMVGIGIGVAGLIIGIIGLYFGFREKFLSQELKKNVERIEKAKTAEIWTNIGIVLTIFDALEEARNRLLKQNSFDPIVLSKVVSARRGTVDQYRLLLKEAVLAENNFSLETINKWKEEGKLENEWRIKSAKRLLPSNNQKNKTADKY